jgi:formate-dependent phosphoribosylglycinamide formyltransferase (GAR transformylase)
VRTILFVGAGRLARRAIVQAKAAGLRTAVLAPTADAPGAAEAEIAKVADVADTSAAVKATARLRIDGVVALDDGAAGAAAAAIAEARGLPRLGAETRRLLANRIALRRRLTDAGIPQPRFAAVRTLSESRRAAPEVGFPALLQPADAPGPRGVFRVESLDDVDIHLHEALVASPTEEAILEELVEGQRVRAAVVVRDREAVVLTVSSDGVSPAELSASERAEAERVAVHAVHALGAVDAIVAADLVTQPRGTIVVAGCTAGIPDLDTLELVRAAVGVDLVDVQIRLALGDPPCEDGVRAAPGRPAAIRPLVAGTGALPAGRIARVGPLDKLLAFPGVLGAEVELRVGETIEPGRRYGYVVATGTSGAEAAGRADAAARLLDVEVD